MAEGIKRGVAEYRELREIVLKRMKKKLPEIDLAWLNARDTKYMEWLYSPQDDFEFKRKVYIEGWLDEMVSAAEAEEMELAEEFYEKVKTLYADRSRKSPFD